MGEGEGVRLTCDRAMCDVHALKLGQTLPDAQWTQSIDSRTRVVTPTISSIRI